MSNDSLPFPITCLVRGEDRVTKLNNTYGKKVDSVLYKDLDDIDRTIEVASEHDIVINTTLGYHPESAAALVRGLAKRKQSTGKEVWMIHTSGTSNLADTPITGLSGEDNAERVFDDSKDDIYGYEKKRNEAQPYGQRTSELGVIDTGLETGVKTLVIMSPTIYGLGTGLYNNLTIQIPSYTRSAIANGQTVVIGDGNGVWDHVHIEDLVVLYEICVREILENGGKDLPSGKKGIIFSENGTASWKTVAQGVADAAYQSGKIKTNEVKSVPLSEGAEFLTGGNEQLAELGFSSNSKTKGVVGRKLGWKPIRGEKAFQDHFTEELKEIIKADAK